MTVSPPDSMPEPSGDTAEHLSRAREKARQVLGSEAHLGATDDWRRAFISARDSVIYLWLAWLVMYGPGRPDVHAGVLLAFGVGVALLIGISTGRSAHATIQFYTKELERERNEIRDNVDQEREEVRVLYAAKGFQEPLLGKVVDTLCADDDRLLKVMMEEELGLSMHYANHPLLVGASNFGAALVVGLVLTVPLLCWSGMSAHGWVFPAVVLALLVSCSLCSAWVTGRSVVELIAESVIMTFVTGGVVYFLGRWLDHVLR